MIEGLKSKKTNRNEYKMKKFVKISGKLAPYLNYLVILSTISKRFMFLLTQRFFDNLN
jgi:hypothetical protein